MLKDLKAFLLRGNVVDLAVAVVIGAAFGAIVTSFVNDIITPLILKPAMKAAGVDKIANLSWKGVAYGRFLSAVINFLIVAFVVLLHQKRSKLSDLQSVKACLCTPQTCYSLLPASEKWRKRQQKISPWLAQAE